MHGQFGDHRIDLAFGDGGEGLWMSTTAPDRIEQVTGLYVGVFTASIALGAFIGGLVVESAGIVPLLWTTSALAAVALAIGLGGSGPNSRPEERAR